MVDEEQPTEPGPAAPDEWPAAPRHDLPPAQRSAWARRRRAWTVVTHRAAGWVVAAALAGAVIALSAVLAARPTAVPVAFGVAGPRAGQVPSGERTITLRPGQMRVPPGWLPAAGPGQVFVGPPGQFAAGPGTYTYGPGPFVYGPGPFVHGPVHVFAGPGGFTMTPAPALRPGKIGQVIRGCTVSKAPPGVRISCRVVPRSPAAGR